MKRTSIFALVVLLAASLFVSGEIAARKKAKVIKPKGKKAVIVKQPRARKSAVIVTLPAKHKKIVVKDKHYYHHAGVWYKHGANGYAVIKAPLGARLTMLPIGHRKMFISNRTFFYYYGTYYLLDAESKEYYVVGAPSDPASGDVLTMVDGEVLRGQYLGGNAETIEFGVDDKLYEIDVADVISLEFEPGLE